MASSKHVEEIEKSLPTQIREWKTQRVAWGILVLLWLAALSGLLGRGGPLSHASTGNMQSSVRVEYERFARNEAPQTLRLRVRSADAAKDEIQIRLSNRYLQQVEISAVEPVPQMVKAAGQAVTYTFSKEKGETNLDATFFIKAQTIGSLQGQAGLPGQPQHNFSQFVFP